MTTDAASPAIIYRSTTRDLNDREATAWVSATGRAALLTGPVAAETNWRLWQRFMTDEGLATIGSLLKQREDATIVVTAERWKAWEYESTLLAAIAAAGIPLEDADRWYRD